jgi:thiol-disulfide isomerase/thioredoxin
MYPRCSAYAAPHAATHRAELWYNESVRCPFDFPHISMRVLFCACLLTSFFVLHVSAQDLEQLRKTIDTNISAITLDTLNDLFVRKPPTPESVKAGKAIVEAAAQIYALPNLSETDRQKILQREAAALIVLAYADTATYYPRLTLTSDELERRGLQKLVEETERHVLEIGSDLATRTGNNNVIKIDAGTLAERMVLYAQQYPGAVSMSIIEHFVQRIRAMTAIPRDMRLAKAAPIFYQYFRTINHIAKADSLAPDILRATLADQTMFLMGVDINGKDFDITSIKDKVVLLQFWGTWCVNCMAEMPELIALYEKYHDKGLEIIGINTGVQGDDEKKVKQFLDTKTFDGKKIPWTILHEGLGFSKNKNTITKIYGIEELPVLILIGRNGKVLNLHPLPSTLDDRIAYAVSYEASIELTEEEQKQREEILRKQREEIDKQIEHDLAQPPK